MDACRRGSLSQVSSLLDKGADVDCILLSLLSSKWNACVGALLLLKGCFRTCTYSCHWVSRVFNGGGECNSYQG